MEEAGGHRAVAGLPEMQGMASTFALTLPWPLPGLNGEAAPKAVSTFTGPSSDC